MAHKYEVEIKSLLGEKSKAEALSKKILEKGGKAVSKHKQLNHYFIVSDVAKFFDNLINHINEEKKDSFQKILKDGKDFSIRTRDADGKVLLVVKASIDAGTSSNAVSRMEFESEMNMSLEELDKLLLESGLTYQAKWSREREDYTLGGTNICIDKNAGYGYLAEFEKVVDDESVVNMTRDSLLELMRDFEVEELPQDRLERMFAHYNSHWQDYYGTDKIFNIT